MSNNNQTQKLLFVLGKNSRLSLAEIIVYFSVRNIRFKITDFGKQFVIIQFFNPIKKEQVIKDLGSILKICSIIKETSKDSITEMTSGKQVTLIPNEIEFYFRMIKGRLMKSKLFGISIYVSDLELAKEARYLYKFMGNYLKSKSEVEGGKKIRFMGFPHTRRLPQLTNVEVLKRNLLDQSLECIIGIGKKFVYFGITGNLHNPFEFQERDVKRPCQRTILGISPRLAKIMVNLSGIRPNQKLLDPFCGYGMILQEAVIMGINVVGIDNNSDCVSSTKKNLAWLFHKYHGENFGDINVLKGDAIHLEQIFPPSSFDSIVTEPPLGPPLTIRLSHNKAKEIIEELKALYIGFLKSAYHILKKNGKIVMTTPTIASKEGLLASTDIRELSKESGLILEKPIKSLYFSDYNRTVALLEKIYFIRDFDPEDKIKRQICIFKK